MTLHRFPVPCRRPSLVLLACLTIVLGARSLPAQEGSGGFCDQQYFEPIGCTALVLPSRKLLLTPDGVECTLRASVRGPVVRFEWRKVSGPPGAEIVVPDGRETPVTFERPGAYTFEVTGFPANCNIADPVTSQVQLTVAPDCNSNGVEDAADIRLGTSPDVNGNALPDECEGGMQVTGDCNQDGALDISDPICLLGFLFTGASSALPCGDGSAGDAANLRLLDTGADAALDISDAIRLLGFLFGGSAPPAWIEPCGRIAGCPEGPGACSV